MSPQRGYVGRIGIVIEVSPGKFLSVRLHGIEATIEREIEETAFSLYDRFPVGPETMRIEVRGYVAGEEYTEPPQWAAGPVAEIEAPKHELPGAADGERLSA